MAIGQMRHEQSETPASATVPALDLRNVTKVFFQPTSEGLAGLLVLDNVSFTIANNEFVAVLGPSGCGKTTLARIIVGLEDVIDGEVLIDGLPAGPPGPNRCLVFQNYGLLPWRDVMGNVELGLELQGVPKEERRVEAQRHIDLVGLTGFEDRYPHQVSGGMQQRAGLARALATRPRMLIMDEPFGSVDAQMRTLLQDELLKIRELTKSTVLFVTHSIDEAIYLSDRILIFSARPGRPIAEVDVDLHKPRSHDIRSESRFAEIRKEVSGVLAERTDYYRGGDEPTFQTD
jgi:NitT/TauT family transport system ATP-binding protein